VKWWSRYYSTVFCSNTKKSMHYIISQNVHFFYRRRM
jgi:hypothetical protein